MNPEAVAASTKALQPDAPSSVPFHPHPQTQVQQDLIAAAETSRAASPPAWASRGGSRRPWKPASMPLQHLPASPREDAIHQAPPSTPVGVRGPDDEAHGAGSGDSMPDIEALTREARALLGTGKFIGWVNGLQRAAAYAITAGVPNKAAAYTTLGITAVVQFCTAYASVATGQVSEKIFTGEASSNVEADMRKIIMSVREVLAISSQATAAGNLAPQVKIPLTAVMTAIYGFMLVVDGVSELKQGHAKLKASSANAGEPYHWQRDKALLASLGGVMTFLLIGSALMGGSFAADKDSQVRQWLFAAGAALICADLTGGLSVLADHFKQKNRELNYGRVRKSRATLAYESSMSVRSTLGLATQIIALTAPDAAHADTVTKIVGGVTNGVAAISGIMRGYSYTGMARVHVRERGSGINTHPENTRQALDGFNSSLLGRATAPLTKQIAGRIKIIGSAASRNVAPLGWSDPE